MYVKKEYIAGKTIEVEKTFSNRYAPKGKRNKKENVTAEKIKKHNEKLATDYLRRLINHNFAENDLHTILTLKNTKNINNKIISRQIKNFHSRMKRELKKINKEYQYIIVTGWIDKDVEEDDTEHPGHTESNVHHHLIIKNVDYKIITKAWSFGRVFMFPLDNSGNYTELANYFIRHTKNNFRMENTPCRLRYSRSRNLKLPPPPKVTKVKASSWRDDPKPKKGYMIVTDSIKVGVSDFSGYPYQFYQMVKIPDRKKRTYATKMQI